MSMPPIETMDADECAALLRCSVDQVEELARTGEIPGVKLGRGWLFVRADLLAYIAELARQQAAERRARHAPATHATNVSPMPRVKPRRRPPPPLPVPLPAR